MTARCPKAASTSPAPAPPASPLLGRSFLENDDPKPTVDLIKSATKIYPYEVGGVGTSVAEFLGGGVKLGKVSRTAGDRLPRRQRLAFNTIPPGDFHAFELLNKVVQQEPATALDPELMGPLAAIGIVKGKPFKPDARMKKIMTEAAAVANATARTLFMNPRDPAWYLLSRFRLDELSVYQRLGVRDADPDGDAGRC